MSPYIQKMSRSHKRRIFGAASYATTLQNIYGADEVWPLVDIASGTTINAFVNSNRDGSLTGWDLQNAAGPVTGSLAPYSDGANDYGNIYTSSLDSIFDGDVGSMFAWCKYSGSWTDGTTRIVVSFRSGSGDHITLRKQSSNNVFLLVRRANGVNKFYNYSTSRTDWYSAGISWDINAGASGELKFFIDGSQVGSTQTGLDAFSGILSSNNTTIGSYSGSFPSSVWDGLFAYVTVKFGSIWTPTQFQNMHNDASTAGAD